MVSSIFMITIMVYGNGGVLYTGFGTWYILINGGGGNVIVFADNFFSF